MLNYYHDDISYNGLDNCTIGKICVNQSNQTYFLMREAAVEVEIFQYKLRLLKLLANGTIGWTFNLIIPYDDSGMIDRTIDMCLDVRGNIYITYQISIDGIIGIDIIKLNSSGTIKWQLSDTPSVSAKVNVDRTIHHQSITVDEFGNIYGAYSTDGDNDMMTVPSNSIKGNIAIFKLNKDGEFVWIKKPNYDADETFNAQDSNGFPRIVASPHGDLYCCHATNGFLAGVADISDSSKIALYKLNTNGKLQWIRQSDQYNNTNVTHPDLVIDMDEKIYCAYSGEGLVVGELNSSHLSNPEIVVFSYDKDGNFLWVSQQIEFNSVSNTHFPCISISDTFVYINGETEFVMDGLDNAQIGQVDSYISKLYKTSGFFASTEQLSTLNKPNYNKNLLITVNSDDKLWGGFVEHIDSGTDVFTCFFLDNIFVNSAIVSTKALTLEIDQYTLDTSTYQFWENGPLRMAPDIVYRMTGNSSVSYENLKVFSGITDVLVQTISDEIKDDSGVYNYCMFSYIFNNIIGIIYIDSNTIYHKSYNDAVWSPPHKFISSDYNISKIVQCTKNNIMFYDDNSSKYYIFNTLNDTYTDLSFDSHTDDNIYCYEDNDRTRIAYYEFNDGYGTIAYYEKLNDDDEFTNYIITLGTDLGKKPIVFQSNGNQCIACLAKDKSGHSKLIVLENIDGWRIKNMQIYDVNQFNIIGFEGSKTLLICCSNSQGLFIYIATFVSEKASLKTIKIDGNTIDGFKVFSELVENEAHIIYCKTVNNIHQIKYCRFDFYTLETNISTLQEVDYVNTNLDIAVIGTDVILMYRSIDYTYVANAQLSDVLYFNVSKIATITPDIYAINMFVIEK